MARSRLSSRNYSHVWIRKMNQEVPERENIGHIIQIFSVRGWERGVGRAPVAHTP